MNTTTETRKRRYVRITDRHIAESNVEVPYRRLKEVMDVCGLTFDFWCWEGPEFGPNRNEMALLLRMDGYSWPSIGRAIKAQSHSTAGCGAHVAIRRLTKEQVDDRWKQYARDGREPKVTLI
jgi:hypothetical protein